MDIPTKPKYVRPKCPHGKSKSMCFICGGSGLCVHKRQKSACVDCGGNGICIHKRKKYSCIECGGSGICVHKKRKDRCIECGGSSLCEHKREKSTCKDCKGGSICEHNTIRSTCVPCEGSQICPHTKNIKECRECGGSSFCEHDRRKKYCKECGGSQICKHNRIKCRCVDCDGGSICEHGKRKRRCKTCGGEELCKSTWCETTARNIYNGYCLYCCINLFPDLEIVRNYKTKERDVVDRIKQAFPDVTWVADKPILDGCSKRKPDLLLDLGSHILMIEIDENQHKYYDSSCETARLNELSIDVNHRSIVMLRFNPDSYGDGNNKIKSCWKINSYGVMSIVNMEQWLERIECLKKQIRYCMDNSSDEPLKIIEMYYDQSEN
jgi:hypothetical protein